MRNTHALLRSESKRGRISRILRKACSRVRVCEPGRFEQLEARQMLALTDINFSYINLGTPAAGSADYDTATQTFTLTGATGDLWGQQDNAMFAYSNIKLVGDGVITARVATLPPVGTPNLGGWMKAGVDIRADLLGESAHASSIVTTGNNAQFAYRPFTWNNSSEAPRDTSVPGGTVRDGTWVRLTRVGNRITSQWSTDGTTWNMYAAGSQSTRFVDLPSEVYVGLVVCTNLNDATQPMTVTFDNVTIEDLPDTPLNRIQGDGSGIIGQYFANDVTGRVISANFDVPITVNRLETTRFDNTQPFPLSHYWGDGPEVAPGVGANNFSTRFSTELTIPVTGRYYFRGGSDDGQRLYINGQCINHNWVWRGHTWDYARNSTSEADAVPLDFTAGQVITIVQEAFEGGGGASAAVEWRAVDPANGNTELWGWNQIPASQLTAKPVATHQAIAFVRATQVDLRWEQAGGATSYNIYRNGTQIATGVTTTSYTDFAPVAGATYAIETVNAELGLISSGKATAMNVTGAPGNGVIAQYTAQDGGGPQTSDFDHQTTVTQIVPEVLFYWGDTDPVGGGIGNNDFSSRYAFEFLVPATGSYRFRGGSDDGIRVWVNGVLVVNSWVWRGHPGEPWDNAARINLTAGQRVPVIVEHFEGGGDASVTLAYDIVSLAGLGNNPGIQGWQTIPQYLMYAVPSAPQQVMAYSEPGKVTVDWSDGAGQASHRVYRREVGGAWTMLTEIPWNSKPYWNRFVDTTVEAGKSYEYAVSSVSDPSVGTIESAKSVAVAPKPVTGSLSFTYDANNIENQRYNLTAIGSVDWIKIGGGEGIQFVRKAGVPAALSWGLRGTTWGDWQEGGPGWGGWGSGFDWNDGTAPNQIGVDNNFARTTSYDDPRGAGAGFYVTAPADLYERTLTLWVGGWSIQPHLLVSISDGSTVPVDDITLSGNLGGDFFRRIDIKYKAASAGQTIRVDWYRVNDGAANVKFQGVALSGGPAAPVSALTAIPGPHQVYLSWPTSVGATGYNMYRKLSSQGDEAYVKLNATPILGVTYYDMTAENDTTYDYVVRALDQLGVETDPSPKATATPFDDLRPYLMGVVKSTSNISPPFLNSPASVTLTWDQALFVNKPYSIYRAASPTPVADPDTLTYTKLADVAATTYTDTTGVSLGNYYYYKLGASNDGGETLSGATSIAIGDGTGLLGSYWNWTGNNQQPPYANAPISQRLDRDINFFWGDGNPGMGVGNDFWIRWQGQVMAQKTEAYHFIPGSDDGIRLKIDLNQDGTFGDGETLTTDAGSWYGRGHTYDTYLPWVNLTQGQWYNIEVEWYDSGGGASATLEWETATTSRQIVPVTQLRPTFDNVPPDAPSSLTVTALSPYAVKVSFIDNGTTDAGHVIERATSSSGPFERVGTAATAGGTNYIEYTDMTAKPNTTYWYRVRAFNLAYSDPVGPASVTTPNGPTVAGIGLDVTYYDEQFWTGMTHKRIDPAIYQNWGSGSPVPGIIGPDTFSATWEGTLLIPITGDYRFYEWVDDEFYFDINGERIITQTGYTNQEQSHDATAPYSLYLEAGTLLDIRVRMSEGGGGAGAILRWETTDGTIQKDVVPQRFLSPVDFSGRMLAPTNLSAVATSNSTIRLLWTDRSNNDRGYNVYQSSSASGPWTKIGTTAQGVSGFVAKNLEAGTQYFFQVRGFNDGPTESDPASADAITLTVTGLDNPVGHWTFEDYDPFAYRTEDVSVNDNYAYFSGSGATPQYVTDRMQGNYALSFDSTTYQHLQVPDITYPPVLLPQYAISVMAWIKADDWDGNRRILQKGDEGTVDPSRAYRLLAEWGELTFDVPGVGSVTTALPAAGSWTHVAGVYNGGELKLYINGTEAASELAFGNLLTDTGDQLVIGAKEASGAVEGDFFKGLMDDVRIYDRAVDPAAIQQLVSGAGVPDAPTNLTARPYSNYRIALNWTDNAVNETAIEVWRKAPGDADFSLRATIAPAMPWFDTGLAEGTYTYKIRAINLNGFSTFSNEISATAVASTLPAPWLTQDIGPNVGTNPTVGDANWWSDLGYVVDGDGNDIWDNADAFRYVYTPATGDGEVYVRIMTQENTNVWAKAGVMIRETLTPGSRHVMLVTTPSNGIELQYRQGTNSLSGNLNIVPAANNVIPVWLKLIRSGDDLGITLSYAENPGPADWGTIGWQTGALVGLTENFFVGLAVTSHSQGTLCTVTAEDLTETFAEPVLVSDWVIDGTSGDDEATLTRSGDVIQLKMANVVVDSRPLSGLKNIIINGLDGNDRMWFDAGVAAFVAAGNTVTFNGGGGGSDTIGVIGTAGGSSVTATAAGVSFDGKSVAISGVENLAVVGAAATNTLTVTDGSFGVAGAANLNVVAQNAAAISFNAATTLKGLNLQGTSKATLAQSGTNILTTGGLSIASGATLDIADNGVVVRNGDLAAIQALVMSGATEAFDWTGTGITSSAAADSASALYQTVGIGAIINDYGDGTQVWDAWRGVSGLAATDVLISYTWYGDANLDGQLEGFDFALQGAGFTGDGSGWLFGDINMDGAIEGFDFALMGAGFTGSRVPGDPTFQQSLSLFDPNSGGGGGAVAEDAAVADDEPVAVTLVLPAAAAAPAAPAPTGSVFNAGSAIADDGVFADDDDLFQASGESKISELLA